MQRSRPLALLLVLTVLFSTGCYPPSWLLGDRQALELSTSGPRKDDNKDLYVPYFALHRSGSTHELTYNVITGTVTPQVVSERVALGQIFALNQNIDRFTRVYAGISYNDDFRLNMAGVASTGQIQTWTVNPFQSWLSSRSGVSWDGEQKRFLVSGYNGQDNRIYVYQSNPVGKDASITEVYAALSQWTLFLSIFNPSYPISDAYFNAIRFAMAVSATNTILFYQSVNGQLWVYWWVANALLMHKQIGFFPILSQFWESVAYYSRSTGIAYWVHPYNGELYLHRVYPWGDYETIKLGKVLLTDQFYSIAVVESPRGFVHIFAPGRGFTAGEGYNLKHWIFNLWTGQYLVASALAQGDGLNIGAGAMGAFPIFPRHVFDYQGQTLKGYGATLYYPGLLESLLLFFCGVDVFGCIPDDETMCYESGFRLTARYLVEDESNSRPRAIQTNPARMIPISGDTTAIYFFEPDNVEAIAKVIDACKSTGFYWFFAGGLTNLGVELELENLATGKTKTYKNGIGKAFQPIQDTKAFACPRSRDAAPAAGWRQAERVIFDDTGPPPTQTAFADFSGGPSWWPPLPEHLRRLPAAPAEITVADRHPTSNGISIDLPLANSVISLEAPMATCSPSKETLCLLDGRFKVEADWKRKNGQEGSGKAQRLSDDSGYLWFFDSANVEMQVKMRDACNRFDHFWVFGAGLTDVRVDLTVTDTMTGQTKTYKNPQGTAFKPIQDVTTFDC